MPPGAAPEVPLEFTETQDRVVLDLARYIQYAAGASLALGALGILTGLVLWFWLWTSFWGGLFAIVIGAGTVFLGLVLLSTATDMRYIAETKGYDKIHLVNGFTSINVWLTTQIALASILGVVMLFRLFA
ncbi:MAG: hypothetical protein U0793_33280 [Gemmataceae bacterium]